MRVSYNTYPYAFGVPGGGERQLHFCKDAISRQINFWPELNVNLFNMWNPDFHHIDLMHYFSCMPDSLEFLSFCKKKFNIPLVISPNFWPEPEEWKLTGVFDQISSIFWLADKLIVNSFIEKEALVRLCRVDPSKIHIVPNAVNDCYFDAISADIFRKEFNITGEFILNVANVEPRKNQLAFLKALKRFPQLQLITIGGVRNRWYASECIKEGGAQFRIIEALAPGSIMLRSAMAACKFFAMPSLIETPSIASLEAGAAGAKLLMTDQGSTKEYFHNHVTYINPYDINNISDSIDEILLYSKDGVLAEHIKLLYRWDIVVVQLVRCYSDLLKKVF
ncbi:glycosyltransferase involved in cell wall biosynthesis [Polynucleobacter sphagniphilus]|uniref:glycosyltransferase family 4 protein n=1 Tax=Polynucleobacter sphagniphilus TaxID=1743169 RepID=UPI002474DCF8|nr:glycosyltransferase family 4 protein [Polynucleobacter sphagniphilus]MDH6420907.1 glycosyltransferase involved in cell wall biosynthesis [Polynucleobacter sphagniphilus]